MKLPIVAAAILGALLGASAAAAAQGLTPEDFQYLQTKYGVGPHSAVITELTANETNALHSAIDDLKTYPAGRDREVQSYLALVYGRECKRWERAHPGQPCSPAADPAVAPGKVLSDRYCAECHLFGTQTAPSYRQMAHERDWNAHKISH
ncbi:MAG: hypothetical protein ACREFB_18665, partial [Stellaceae bacterium]